MSVLPIAHALPLSSVQLLIDLEIAIIDISAVQQEVIRQGGRIQ